MSQLLAWICLVLVACTTAYGLQLTAAEMFPSHVAAEHVTSLPLTRKVLIVLVDPVTGDRAQMECNAPANNFAPDVGLVIPADSADGVWAHACNGPA